jgi:mono/diheme cytochrome c family protein
MARTIALIVVAAFAALAGAGFLLAWHPPIEPISAPDPKSFAPALVRRGAELAAIGNCNTCHSTPGGKSFAGGVGVPTPFGTVYSTNITPDAETGIGRWSEAAFRRSMREGVDRAGHHLYPAFPYDHFTLVSDDDNKALYAYLMSREPVRAAAPVNDLRFPFSLRFLLAGWKLFFLHPGPYRPDASHSETWNRGAYLAEGLAHCGACHTPRNAFGAETKASPYAGGEAEGWTAYALNRQSPAPVAWDAQALYDFLHKGWQGAHGLARGPMAAVTENLSLANETDVRGIAVYFADLMGEPTPERRQQGEALLAATRNPGSRGQPVTADSTTNAVHASEQPGGMIYAFACATCHESGRPLPFGGIDLSLSTAMQGPNPRNVINVVLAGLPAAADGEMGPIMPGFAGAMTDQQLANLLEYLRSRFSDRPPWPDIATDVREARTRIRPIIAYPSRTSGGGPAERSPREKPW